MTGEELIILGIFQISPQDIIEDPNGLDMNAAIALLQSLSGTKVIAFGGKPGLWGTSSQETYPIWKIATEYWHEEYPKQMDIQIFLKGYNANKKGLIYTDPTFEKDISSKFKSLIPDAKVSYTEQGMQGQNYVSMSFSYKKKILK